MLVNFSSCDFLKSPRQRRGDPRKMFFLSSITGVTDSLKQPSIPLAISNQTEIQTDVKEEENRRENISGKTSAHENECEVDIGSELRKISPTEVNPIGKITVNLHCTNTNARDPSNAREFSHFLENFHSVTSQNLSVKFLIFFLIFTLACHALQRE
jgi:hypothetical protein